MQEPNRYDWFNYVGLAFTNGMSDAVSVILLHEVFAVLMSGNIIFSFVDLATKLEFADIVRFMLIAAFILSNIISHRYFIKLQVGLRLAMVAVMIIAYCIVGNYTYSHGYLAKDANGFLWIAMLATITSVLMNNIFYQIHKTRYNLVAYTMNILNLAHFVADRKYDDVGKILVPIISFASGVFISALLVQHFQFYTILLALPLLCIMYFIHRHNQSAEQTC